MDWKETLERRERLESGEWPGVIYDNRPIIKDILFDTFLMKQGTLRNFLTGTRSLSRLFVTENHVRIFEYELRGEFGVYKVPINEITDVSSLNSETVLIKGDYGREARFITNLGVEWLIDTINQARIRVSKS